MPTFDIDLARVIRGAGGTDSPVIYVIDAVEFPFDLGPVAAGLQSTVVSVPVANWNDALSPWPADALHMGDPGFGGHGPEALDELLDKFIPAVEGEKNLAPRRRAICGYSLGGLFALYALAESMTFDACAALSASLWYEGWVDYLRRRCEDAPEELSGRFAYLSVGTKEKRGGPPIVRGVQRAMGECADILAAAGCETRFVTGPGNHVQYQQERYSAGLSALDAWLNV